MGKIYNKFGMTAPGAMHMGEFRPLDPRFVVDSVSALTAQNTFKTIGTGGTGDYVYPGLQVYCTNENEVWMFAPSGITTTSLTDDTPDISFSTYTSKIANWRKLSDKNFSIDKIQDNLDKLAQAVGVSGCSSADTFGYSAHTTPTFITNQAPTSIQTEIIAIENSLTPRATNDSSVVSTDTDVHKNIIKVYKDGIEAFADLHYNSATNTLQFVNTNGTRTINLAGINFISGASYNSVKEEIEIYYQKPGETSASTLSIPVKDLIEEYSFKYASSAQTSDGKTTYVEYNKDFTENEHNVSIKMTRDVSGKTSVYGDIDIFDCGTY